MDRYGGVHPGPDARSPTQADATPIANVRVRSWRAAYRGLRSDDILAGLPISDRKQL